MPNKYDKARFYVETTHGCYSECGWCYLRHKETLEEAIAAAKSLQHLGVYRVVDHEGNIYYPRDESGYDLY
jgi:hypothetical protein